MKRISTTTRVVDKFGVGKAGFTNGDVAGGVPATDLEADWFDSVQEEICGVIDAAGISLNVSVRTQLLQALRSAGVFSTQAAADSSTKVATTAWAKLGMAMSLAANGYVKFPDWMGGFMVQWGNMNNVASATTTTNFQIQFPSACFAVVPAGLQATGNQQAYVTLNSIGLSSFNWNGFHAVGGSAPVLSATAAAVQGRFIAIGL